MHIAVNLRHYLKGRIGGQENYLQGMLSGLARRAHELTIFTRPSEFEAVRAMAGAPVRLVPVPDEGRPMLRAVAAGGFDLLFCPLHTLEPLDPPVPSAVMIPDLQHEFFPQHFDERELARRRRSYWPSAMHASVVLTCSEFSKRTIVEQYLVAPEKVVVCGHGLGAEFSSEQTDSEALRALGLPQEYLYFPAFYWPHKNHLNALRALKLVHERGRGDLHLVCTGGEGPDRERVARLADELGLTDRVKLLGRVESSLIPAIYRGSRGLLFATLFEGFGIPVLESLHLGVPVITSRGGAAEEVAGGCAVLVDPLDPESSAGAIETVLSDKELRDALAVTGRRRSAEFSWDRAVETTLAAMERVTAPGYVRPCRIEVEEWPMISVVVVGDEPAVVESVRRQEYPHVECVVAGDVNAGFRATTGALFAYLKPHDQWLPGAAARVAACWKENSRAGLIYGKARAAEGLVGSIPYLYEDLNYGPLFAPPAAFYARTAFESAGRMGDEPDPIRELSLWLRVARANPVVGLEDCLAVWGPRDPVQFGKLRKHAIALIRQHFEYVPETWIDGRACHRLLGQRAEADWRLMSLWRGMLENPGRRRRYLHEWLRGGGAA